jgi:hypothetical protein
MDEPRAYTDSLDSPRPGLGGFPLIVFYMINHKVTPNVILSHNSQVESPKILEIKIHATLNAYNFLCKPPIKVRFFKNLYPCQKLSINMWHATYTQIN